ncbi:hypothetical protein PROH_14560 [Prochlorothrix hollandica PCC 9006 = CALU 1027]|uniref:Restriction endonuclease domain-containing protein n=1 Tax=Prochlorothrix hollandica PCC 9006 = CALU 1027 TaxID=317619 RepID=A0A0M2PXB9_PROHO|nr:hypothetical protein [Prochlorothrix hollandica]KKI99026.1 hypothetical protein PROH_14560 [Prochlorothrix hollandica PCC 9006 = CALU 1027]
MKTASAATIALEQFLLQPGIEESPAWEWVEGEMVQKPMPSLFHSRLQRNLVNSPRTGEGSESISGCGCCRSSRWICI